MENFQSYVDQISTALELNPNQKENITTLFTSFKDNEKLQLISQTQDRVNELLAADEQIKALKTGSLSQYMVNIQENWNMMSENLVQLQILSLFQKKGADCSEVINDILKILNTKLTAVNQILKANLGEVSSKTTSASSGLQQEVLSQADKAVAAAKTTAAKTPASVEAPPAKAATAAAKPAQTTAAATAPPPAKTPESAAKTPATAKVDSGQKLLTVAASASAATKAAAQLKAAAQSKAAAKPAALTTPQPAAAKTPGAATTTAAPAAAKLAAVSTAKSAPAAAPAAPGTKSAAAPPPPAAAAAAKPAPAAAAAAKTGANFRGGDDIYLYKYLKYKTKYLSLKNNF